MERDRKVVGRQMVGLQMAGWEEGKQHMVREIELRLHVEVG